MNFISVCDALGWFCGGMGLACFRWLTRMKLNSFVIAFITDGCWAATGEAEGDEAFALGLRLVEPSAGPVI
jgi:hypothetical protein